MQIYSVYHHEKSVIYNQTLITDEYIIDEFAIFVASKFVLKHKVMKHTTKQESSRYSRQITCISQPSKTITSSYR